MGVVRLEMIMKEITDTERLDWLQNNQTTVWQMYHEEWEQSTTTNPEYTKIQVMDGWVVNPDDEPKQSIREAIDEAMKK